MQPSRRPVLLEPLVCASTCNRCQQPQGGLVGAERRGSRDAGESAPTTLRVCQQSAGAPDSRPGGGDPRGLPTQHWARRGVRTQPPDPASVCSLALFPVCADAATVKQNT